MHYPLCTCLLIDFNYSWGNWVSTILMFMGFCVHGYHCVCLFWFGGTTPDDAQGITVGSLPWGLLLAVLMWWKSNMGFLHAEYVLNPWSYLPISPCHPYISMYKVTIPPTSPKYLKSSTVDLSLLQTPPYFPTISPHYLVVSGLVII